MLLWLLLSYTKSLTLHTKPAKLEWSTHWCNSHTLQRWGPGLPPLTVSYRLQSNFDAKQQWNDNNMCQAILNGVKLAIRCNLFVIMWLVTEINWWKFQVCYCQHTQNCALSRNSHSLFTIWDSQTVLAVSLCVEMTITCKLCESDFSQSNRIEIQSNHRAGTDFLVVARRSYFYSGVTEHRCRYAVVTLQTANCWTFNPQS